MTEGRRIQQVGSAGCRCQHNQIAIPSKIFCACRHLSGHAVLQLGFVLHLCRLGEIRVIHADARELPIQRGKEVHDRAGDQARADVADAMRGPLSFKEQLCTKNGRCRRPRGTYQGAFHAGKRKAGLHIIE